MDDRRDDEWTTSELLRRVDAGWSWLVYRLGQFPEERLDEQVSGGWTRRQMIQHLIVWHELTIGRLAEFQRTGQRPEMAREVDEINEDAKTAAAGRSRADLMADLESSFRVLRAEIARLRDEQLPQLDFWPGAVVAGNTFGHYEEHRADLEQ